MIWASESVLKVPASAVFRNGQRWNAFAIENGRTRLLTMEIGHRSSSEVEITKGLDDGAKVILHPANDLKDGARVTLRGK